MLFILFSSPGTGKFGGHPVDLYKQVSKLTCLIRFDAPADCRYLKACCNFGSSLVGDIQKPAVIQMRKPTIALGNIQHDACGGFIDSTEIGPGQSIHKLPGCDVTIDLQSKLIDFQLLMMEHMSATILRRIFSQFERSSATP